MGRLLPPLSLYFIFCQEGHGRPHLMQTCGHHTRWSPSVPRVMSAQPFVRTSNCKGKRGVGGHRAAEWGRRCLSYGHRKWTLVSENNHLQFCFVFRAATFSRCAGSQARRTEGPLWSCTHAGRAHGGSAYLSPVPMSFSVTQDKAGGAEDGPRVNG